MLFSSEFRFKGPIKCEQSSYFFWGDIALDRVGSLSFHYFGSFLHSLLPLLIYVQFGFILKPLIIKWDISKLDLASDLRRTYFHSLYLHLQVNNKRACAISWWWFLGLIIVTWTFHNGNVCLLCDLKSSYSSPLNEKEKMNQIQKFRDSRDKQESSEIWVSFRGIARV